MKRKKVILISNSKNYFLSKKKKFLSKNTKIVKSIIKTNKTKNGWNSLNRKVNFLTKKRGAKKVCKNIHFSEQNENKKVLVLANYYNTNQTSIINSNFELTKKKSSLWDLNNSLFLNNTWMIKIMLYSIQCAFRIINPIIRTIKRFFRFYWRTNNFLKLKKNKFSLVTLFFILMFLIRTLYKIKKSFLWPSLTEVVEKKELYFEKVQEIGKQINQISWEDFQLELFFLDYLPEYQIIWQNLPFLYEKPFFVIFVCLIFLCLILIYVFDWLGPMFIAWYYVIINKFSKDITQSKTYWDDNNTNMFFGVEDKYTQKRLHNKYIRIILFIALFFTVFFFLIFIFLFFLTSYIDLRTGYDKDYVKSVKLLAIPESIEDDEVLYHMPFEERSTATAYSEKEYHLFKTQYNAQWNNGRFYVKNKKWVNEEKNLIKAFKNKAIEKKDYATLKSLKHHKKSLKHYCKNILNKTETGKSTINEYTGKKPYIPISEKEYQKFIDQLPKEYDYYQTKDGTIVQFLQPLYDNFKNYPNHDQRDGCERNIFFKMIFNWVKNIGRKKKVRK